ncbi:hypothetical protein [Nocardioides jiangxiensis]|uniref:DUF983 domain-containing protein n=1 Tax=Nocardioides jiangxiensis TaxID=3064524 RepID=A0ABT9AYW9_9ACTN|nr:hypothetical protein [Nocardioides sp. WY-20]MDO7867548.1 hypothetical protein [Nocardioides sp. WY-20]
MKVTDPSGQTWRVTRRWVPWRRRVRSRDDLWLDWLDPTYATDLDDFVIGLAVLVAVLVILVVAPIVLVVFFAAFELVLLLALLPLVVLLRVLFGMTWTIEVRRGFTPWAEREAGDWSASRLAIHRTADAIRRGEVPTRAIPAVRWGRLARTEQ